MASAAAFVLVLLVSGAAAGDSGAEPLEGAAAAACPYVSGQCDSCSKCHSLQGPCQPATGGCDYVQCGKCFYCMSPMNKCNASQTHPAGSLCGFCDANKEVCKACNSYPELGSDVAGIPITV